MNSKSKWYDSRENLIGLMDWLEETGQMVVAWDWIKYFLRKPWKWQTEWEEFLVKHPKWKV